jgi:hypothetical protein
MELVWVEEDFNEIVARLKAAGVDIHTYHQDPEAS